MSVKTAIVLLPGRLTYVVILAAALASALAFVAPVSAAPLFTDATRIDATGETSVVDVKALPDGGTLIGGQFAGTVRFGATALTSAGLEDGFVARRAADGGYVWARQFGGTGEDGVVGMAGAPDGSVFVAGYRGPTTDQTGFVAKLSAGGTEVWSRDIWSPHLASGANSAIVNGVVALPDGGAIAVGDGDADQGGCQCITFGTRPTPGTLSVVAPFPTGGVAWVTRLDGSGGFTWVRGFIDTGSGAVRANAVAALPGGNVAVGGRFTGTAQFGSQALTETSASFSGYLARVNGTDGSVAAATAIGATGRSYVTSLDASSAGDVLAGGALLGTASFAGASDLVRAAESAFVALQAPNGTFTWRVAAESAGGSGSSVAAVSLRSDGTALVSGTIAGTPISFGDTSLTSASDDYSSFVAGVSAQGRFRWALTGGTAPHGQTDANGILARPDGTALMGVSISGGEGDAAFGAANLAGAAFGVAGVIGVLDVPIAPAAPTAVAGEERATVTVAPIAGAAITAYTVTASPGGGTCAVAAGATSCTVTGLAPGTAYTFTAAATNSAGTSAASAVSAAVTPTAPTSLTPRLTRAPKIVRSGSSVSLVSSVQVGAPGTLAQSATYVGSARAARAVTACTAKAQAKKAGTVTITCKLNAKARAALRKGALKLTLTTTFTETGKTASSTTRRVTVPRAKPSTRASHGLLG